jgi:hypothetical protein
VHRMYTLGGRPTSSTAKFATCGAIPVRLAATALHRHGVERANSQGFELRLLANPTIAFLATDKVVRNLLSGLSTGHCNPIPPSLLVIDEDMRPRTLNSRLSFEGHSIAAGCVANLSNHLSVTGWPTGVL